MTLSLILLIALALSFDFLNGASEDIYSVTDGRPLN